MSGSITLKELSNISGFSASTISKALNDKIDISRKTKDKITQLAKELNYVPNSFASGLRNNKSGSLAVIVPQINIAFYGDLLFYFQKIAQGSGYKLFLFQSFENNRKELEILNRINDGSADGVIIFTSANLQIDYSENCTIPMVTIPVSSCKYNEDFKTDCINSFKKLLEKIN